MPVSPVRPQHTVFVTGGTGYLGRHLIPRLAARGHVVRALVRPASRHRLPPGAECTTGDALNDRSYRHAVAPADTFVHLVGVAHPSPRKAHLFREIDLVSLEAAVRAAAVAGIRHFVYVSVAQPAPVMQAYVAVRAECEAIIQRSGLDATILRPWYVLGRGHRWPVLLLPLYGLLDLLPATAETSRRLGLVTLEQMVASLTYAVENPACGLQLLDVARIRMCMDGDTRAAAGSDGPGFVAGRAASFHPAARAEAPMENAPDDGCRVQIDARQTNRHHPQNERKNDA